MDKIRSGITKFSGCGIFKKKGCDVENYLSHVMGALGEEWTPKEVEVGRFLNDLMRGKGR
ncbi:hypothetical protein ACFLY6_00820 [Candidatus Dependentiae bacterium]